MIIFRKKHGFIKFYPTNEPVDKKSIELVTEPPAAYEYISLETDLTIKSNDDGRDNGGESKVVENEEEQDIEHHYEDMSNEEKEETEQHYENMTRSIQDKSKEAEMRQMENKVEMREEAVTELAAAYEYISIKTNLTIKSNDNGRGNGKETKVEENEEEEEDMEHHYEVMIGSIQDKSKEGKMREMEIKVEKRKDAIENENPIEAVYANISKKI